ncbi:MAG: NAD-dependent epimerase/dehydratase family protein [Gammaproteobacteria bacterium]|nr:NAD-dependent epimerase/dehydratase family protein [Gammaproteobacteria bacterium]
MNLVTGGAGFIGTHLVEQLLAAGESVRVVERPGASVSHLPLENIELVTADIRDRAAMDKAVQGCRHVYHLAADPNLWRRDVKEFDAINHHGAMNVIHAALETGAERILHTSTESVMTAPDFDGGPAEERRFRETDMIGPYCLSKFRAEEEVWALADAGAPVVLFCPTLPVGPGDRQLTPPTRMALAFCRGELPAYLDCRFNLVDVRDVARAMIVAMKRGRSGWRYVVGGHNYRLIDWLKLLGREIGRPAPRFAVPYPLALTVAYMSEFWARHVSHKMPMATVTGVRLTRRSMHFDPSASLAELDIVPRSLEQSAHDITAWFYDQGWLSQPPTGFFKDTVKER